MNNWYVIAGASSTGKTSLVSELEKRGYKVVHEAARDIIEKGLAEGRTLQEIRKDEHKFQEDVLRMKIAVEKSLSPKDIVFFDRGMHDTLAFYELYGFPVNDVVRDAMKNASYVKVFFLDKLLLPFEHDHVRIESEETQNKLQELLEKVYKSRFEIVRVPPLPLAERADFILNHLRT